MRVLIYFSLILLFTTVPSFAWWENGHILVAQIAKLDLLNHHPEVYSYAERIALYLSDYTFDMSTTFIEAAVWADDIKGTRWSFWNNWHFINHPYDPQGMFESSLKPENSSWAINQTLNVLMNPSSFANITVEKSMMLRMMMHIIGDMHQPLHNVEYFSPKYPNGDQGGNLIQVKFKGKKQNLHAFWDSLGGELPEFTRPLNQTSLSFFEEFSLGLMSQYPRDALADYLESEDPNLWTVQAFMEAVQFAYNPISSDQNLSVEYQQAAYNISRRLITLGGYRLSDMLYRALENQIPAPGKEELII